MKSKENAIKDVQLLRERYIRKLDEAQNKTQMIRELVDDLYALDLTVYSKDYSLDSALYSALAESYIDNKISLHPGQLSILNEIEENDALIVSAPTSFGKTFCIFEYIVRHNPKIVVLVVPTLALIDEYLKKIVKKYNDKFSEYKIHTTLDEQKDYDFNKKNIFILTHDRVVKESLYTIFKRIDFLVIDEVYKLQMDITDDRVLVLNMAYYHLSEIAKKYVLLAPFIGSIEDIDDLNKKPKFFKSTYSPVVNDVKVISIFDDKDRYKECKKLLDSFDKSDKTLIYFPTVSGIYKYVNDILKDEPILKKLDSNAENFIKWAKEEIHDDWCLVKALERGYLIHNGQIPIGTRLFQLDFYEESELYNILLCTSTLLEGVNTTAKNIVITRPSRISEKYDEKYNFTAFDFFNLVGSTGRLNQHLIGTAFYLKGENDPNFIKNDAVKSIRFEITDTSKDVDIQKGNIDAHKDVQDFLNKLDITLEEYLSEIGSHLRFDTVLMIFNQYLQYRKELFNELNFFLMNPMNGRLHLVQILYKITSKEYNGLYANIISNLLNKTRPKIKKIINNTKKYFPRIDINYIIATTIKMKMSYIENDFYTRVTLVRFFMEKEKTSKQLLIEMLNNKVIGAIEQLYFTSSKHKKMLIDLGIYERDVDKIIKIIGDDFDDTVELKLRLARNQHRFNKLSFISKYIIGKLV
ncbi:DEAD/DEAH box helicase [Clostridium magnum]|uniref:DEAD/DEAH box helicase n=1 Tax=Clostridium magnum DSM 2767 TaxID=1121326 RepID=A0A162R4E0_9CLOT|nr:DEAD/DEAH box helicase [Clostridium magnum]KZL89405.1 DEAD/DEAH box helicase [Clostridium magnum DSM 2767]SHI20607.1 DEAD/DEAH box helicase [Clostridium magnum DSM 2767]